MFHFASVQIFNQINAYYQISCITKLFILLNLSGIFSILFKSTNNLVTTYLFENNKISYFGTDAEFKM